MRARSRLLLFILALLLCAPFAANAQETPGNARDLDELQHFVLTLDDVTHFYEAMHDLEQLVSAHPAIAKALDRNSSDIGVTMLANQLSSQPAIVACLAGHQLTPRQYALVQQSYLGITVAASMAGKLGVPPAKLVADLYLNPANLDFLKAHQAELEALDKKYPMTARDDQP